MKKLIIFDMDGTLADTSPGIFNSHRYAHRMMGREEPTDSILKGMIGGPLLQNYIIHFGFSTNDAQKAVSYYRDYYAEKGIQEAFLYPDMKETLIQLKESGFKLAVATLKLEKFAKRMLKSMSVADLFDIIHGMDENDSCTKAELIEMCMNELDMQSDETILIGDSIYDLNGAKEVGISFIGVTYGFGFRNENSKEYNFLTCNFPSQIIEKIGKSDN